MADGIIKYTPLWGEWEVDEQIGEGSYGVVYKIHKTVDDADLVAAAKYISIPKEEDREKYERDFPTEEEEEHRYTELADRYQKEISSMLRLQDSKNVVHCEEYLTEKKDGALGWDIIFRMELLTPLKDRLNVVDLKKHDAIQIGIDICSAIVDCHAIGVTHRDVKIDNIFIDGDGVYKLGDFGVAAERKRTQSGSRTGTEEYMAPEMLRSEPYSSNVDIYALGMVLYRLFNNNKAPFLDAEKNANITEEDDAFARRVNGEKLPNPKFADDMLSAIILKACDADRKKRYQNADDMLNDLQKLLETCEDTVLPWPKSTRKKKQSKSMTGDSGTESDVKKKTGTLSERSRTKGTVSDKDGKVVGSDVKRSKAPVIVTALIAICALCVAGWYFFIRTIPVTDILDLPKETVQLVEDDSYTLEPVIIPENADGELTYTCSDNTVAKVDENGVITALHEGTATVSISAGEITKEVSVGVTAKKIPVTDIEGIPEEGLTAEEGQATQMPSLTVVPENATIKTLTYSSSDESIATIDETGHISAVKPGEVTITVHADEGDDTIEKTMKFTVTAKPVVVTKPATPTPSSQTTTKPATTTPRQNTTTTRPATSSRPATSAPAQQTTRPAATPSPAPAPAPAQQYQAGDLNAFQ